MKKVTKEVLQESANKLMFRLTDEELDKLLDDFTVICQQMELIGDIEGVDNVLPMSFPYDEDVTYLREDVASTPLDKKEALKNAKEVKNGQIVLPKVVG